MKKMNFYLKAIFSFMLVFYGVAIIGILKLFCMCFDGLAAAVGFELLLRFGAGIVLALMLVMATVFWIYLFICFLKEIVNKKEGETEI